MRTRAAVPGSRTPLRHPTPSPLARSHTLPTPAGEGVCVQASTLGSLEALLEFLKSDDVRVSAAAVPARCRRQQQQKSRAPPPPLTHTPAAMPAAQPPQRPHPSQPQIPVSSINIGPINKKDVMRANAMIERGYKKYGVILAFDVPCACRGGCGAVPSECGGVRVAGGLLCAGRMSAALAHSGSGCARGHAAPRLPVPTVPAPPRSQ